MLSHGRNEVSVIEVGSDDRDRVMVKVKDCSGGFTRVEVSGQQAAMLAKLVYRKITITVAVDTEEVRP